MTLDARTVWDRPIRLFHWSLALCVLVSFVSVKLNMMQVHFASGGTVLGLLVFRLLWGIWGSSTARFLQFLPTPARIKNWRAGNTIGHAPLGALATFALLGILATQVSLGLFVDDEIYLTGPLRDMVTSKQAAFATTWHARLSDAVLFVVALHIIAIAVHRLVMDHRIIGTMVHGRGADNHHGEQFFYASPWRFITSGLLAALVVIVVFA